MNKKSYSLASSTWDDDEVRAINAVIESGYYSMGNFVQKFEQQFAQFNDSRYCVMVNSGSSANLLMIASLFYTKLGKLAKGDEVIVPAVSWPTTYYPLVQYGLKLKFIDIDKFTLNYDLDALSDAISEKTRLIVVVNLLGNSNEFDRINQIIEGKNILLVEDNCESLGATYNNKKTGTFGIMGSFSSFFSHHISTMEGGMICTNNEELYHILLSLRAHGWTRNLPTYNHVCGYKYVDPFIESFRFVLPGYNVRPIEFEGAIGSEQLKKLPKFIRTRRDNAKYFVEKFENNSEFIIQKELGQSSWFGFSLVIRKDSDLKRSLITDLLIRNNIECRPIVAGNFAKNEVLKYFDYEIFGELINANLIDSNGLFVGNHHYDIKHQIDYLYDLVTSL